VKSKIRAIRGPQVRYFKHDLGVVNAKRSRLKMGVSVCMSLALLSTSAYGLFNYYHSSTTALRESQEAAKLEQKQTQEQPKLQESSKRAKEDEALAKLIDKKLREMPKGTKWSVSVRDLNSERMANVHADDAHESASLYKLFLLAPLESKLNATLWNQRIAGNTFAGCAELMIKKSDNPCAVAIGNYVTWKNIDITNQSQGFMKTKLNSATSQQTTSREVSDLIYRLQNSQLLSDKARRVVFDGLYRQQFREGIPKGCGPDCLVGNKTGETEKVRHDAAVVTHETAMYVIVIMSEGGTWQQIADVAHTVDQAMLP
jgi:beta-lactamase class A